MREDALERDALLGDELGAFLHAHRAESPGADQRHLPAEEIGTHVERDIAALADVAGCAPRPHAAHRCAACGRGAGAVERKVDADAARQLLQCLHRIFLRGVDHGIGAEFLRQLHALRRSLHRDHPRAHRHAEHGGGQTDRALAENSERVAAAEFHSLESSIGSAGAAGDRGAFGKAELLRQFHDGFCGDFEIVGVPAMRGDAVDRDAGAAELRPADAAVRADAAARVVMVHHALAGRRFVLRYAGTARHHHAAGLVTTDEWFAVPAKPERGLRGAGRRAVELEIRAAHARGLHLEHHFARTGRRIGEAAQLDVALAEEDDAAHAASSAARAASSCRRICAASSTTPSLCPSTPSRRCARRGNSARWSRRPGP